MHCVIKALVEPSLENHMIQYCRLGHVYLLETYWVLLSPQNSSSFAEPERKEKAGE